MRLISAALSSTARPDLYVAPMPRSRRSGRRLPEALVDDPFDRPARATSRRHELIGDAHELEGQHRSRAQLRMHRIPAGDRPSIRLSMVHSSEWCCPRRAVSLSVLGERALRRANRHAEAEERGIAVLDRAAPVALPVRTRSSTAWWNRLSSAFEDAPQRWSDDPRLIDLEVRAKVAAQPVPVLIRIVPVSCPRPANARPPLLAVHVPRSFRRPSTWELPQFSGHFQTVRRRRCPMPKTHPARASEPGAVPVSLRRRTWEVVGSGPLSGLRSGLREPRRLLDLPPERGGETAGAPFASLSMYRPCCAIGSALPLPIVVRRDLREEPP